MLNNKLNHIQVQQVKERDNTGLFQVILDLYVMYLIYSFHHFEMYQTNKT